MHKGKIMTPRRRKLGQRIPVWPQHQQGIPNSEYNTAVSEYHCESMSPMAFDSFQCCCQMLILHCFNTVGDPRLVTYLC